MRDGRHLDRRAAHPRPSSLRPADGARGLDEIEQCRNNQDRLPGPAGGLACIHPPLRFWLQDRHQPARRNPRAGAPGRALGAGLAGFPVDRAGNRRDRVTDGRPLRVCRQRGHFGQAPHCARGPRQRTAGSAPGTCAVGAGDQPGHGRDAAGHSGAGRPAGHRPARADPRLPGGGQDRHGPNDRPGHAFVQERQVPVQFLRLRPGQRAGSGGRGDAVRSTRGVLLRRPHSSARVLDGGAPGAPHSGCAAVPDSAAPAPACRRGRRVAAVRFHR